MWFSNIITDSADAIVGDQNRQISDIKKSKAQRNDVLRSYDINQPISRFKAKQL